MPFAEPILRPVSFSTPEPFQEQDTKEKKEPRFWLDEGAAEIVKALSSDSMPLDKVYVLRWDGYQNCKVEGEAKLEATDGSGPMSFDLGLIGNVVRKKGQNVTDCSGWMTVTMRELPDREDKAFEVCIRESLAVSRRNGESISTLRFGTPAMKGILVMKTPPDSSETAPDGGETPEAVKQILIPPSDWFSIGGRNLEIGTGSLISESIPWLKFKITPIDSDQTTLEK